MYFNNAGNTITLLACQMYYDLWTDTTYTSNDKICKPNSKKLSLSNSRQMSSFFKCGFGSLAYILISKIPLSGGYLHHQPVL